MGSKPLAPLTKKDMKEQLYRKVKASERLPEKGARASVLHAMKSGELFHGVAFYNEEEEWVSLSNDDEYPVLYWLEPIEPTTEESKVNSDEWLIRDFIERYNNWLIKEQYSDADLYAEWDEKGFSKLLTEFLQTINTKTIKNQ